MTIVLVHGAWADGSCRQNVILPYEKKVLRFCGRMDGGENQRKSRVAVTNEIDPIR